MKLHVLSDLHLEFDRKLPWQPPQVDADVLLLAGDIQVGLFMELWFAERLADYKHVIYIPGNHEYYRKDITQINVELPEFCSDVQLRAEAIFGENVGTFHIPMNDEVIIGNVRFLCGTLWTDFNFRDPMSMSVAQMGINDFKMITIGHGRGGFTPRYALDFFENTVAFLEEKLAEPWEGKTVVMTHHLPSRECIHPEYRGAHNHHMNGAFASALDHLVEKADVWVHGHTHKSLDFTLGKCRVVCNPRGYVDENAWGFDPKKVVEV